MAKKTEVPENKDNTFINPQDLVDMVEDGSIPPHAPEDEAYDDEDIEEEAELSYEEGLEDGLSASDEFRDYKSETIIQRREDTRSRLALIYTIATFFIFTLTMCIAVIDGIMRQVSIIENLSQIIPVISGVFLGSLGFVLGYYFRRGDE